MIKHFLKNGQQVDSVAGMVITMKDHPQFYAVLDQINERLSKQEAEGGEK